MAKDSIHESVKDALLNSGWKVTYDPYPILLKADDRFLEADLGAQRVLSLTKGTEQIVVEVKSFTKPSIINQFYEALGQYLSYAFALQTNQVKAELYLAVSAKVYEKIMDISFLRGLIAIYKIQFIVVDVEQKNIVKWINQ